MSAREQVHALADSLTEDQLRAIVAFARYLEDEEHVEPISDEEFRVRPHAAEEIEVDEETKAMLKAARADRVPLTSLEEIERRYGI